MIFSYVRTGERLGGKEGEGGGGGGRGVMGGGRREEERGRVTPAVRTNRHCSLLLNPKNTVPRREDAMATGEMNLRPEPGFKYD